LIAGLSGPLKQTPKRWSKSLPSGNQLHGKSTIDSWFPNRTSIYEGFSSQNGLPEGSPFSFSVFTKT
jgi:hypothetical protein